MTAPNVRPTYPVPPTWPVGALLRFKMDALQPKYRHLRGTRLIVLSPAMWRFPADGVPDWAWRQLVKPLASRGQGWVKPSALEPIPDAPLFLEEPLAEQRPVVKSVSRVKATTRRGVTRATAPTRPARVP